MKKIMLTFILTLISLMIFTPLDTSAREIYYNKGTNYIDTYEENKLVNRDINASVAILTASTTYPGNMEGKEAIRMFARCQYLENYYNSYACHAHKFSMGLHPTYDEVRLFASPSDITPLPHTTKLDWFSYLLSGPLGWTGGFLDAISPALSGVYVTAGTNFPDSARVNIAGITSSAMSVLELPTSVKYNEADIYYNGKAGGITSYIGYNYGLVKGQVGYLTARGHIEYDLRIASSTVGAPPRLVWVKTDEVVVSHTITGK